MNFLVKGDVIFCGYGFTAEDDYLYQLDKNTGEVIDRLPLKKMPDLMAEKDDKLYVHTYSYDYVIEIF
jgi:outer membrane protein assembly factor BamB